MPEELSSSSMHAADRIFSASILFGLGITDNTYMKPQNEKHKG
jgi:hypothetical protein